MPASRHSASAASMMSIKIFVLAASVDVTGLRSESVSCDDHPLDQRMRIALHQVAILE